MTNLDSILKSRDITLPTKIRLVKAMLFPVGMYGYESWTIKKAEHQRIDAFKLWCLRRLLRIPWTARKPNQSIPKEINPEYSLEGLMLKLKLQFFGYLMWRVNSLEKTLMLGKTEGRKRRGWQRMRWLDGITDSMDMNLNKLWDSGGQGSWPAAVHGVAETEQKQHTAWGTNNSRHMSRWNNHCRQPWKCHIHYGNTLPQLGFPRRRHWIADCARSLLGRTLGFNPCAGEGRSGTGRVRRQDVM